MSKRLPTADEIEELVAASPDALGLTAREICEKAGVEARQRAGLRRLLRQLVDGGTLVSLRGRRFGSRRVLGDVIGRFSRHSAGFGFVVPDDAHETDLFIPIGAQATALHGDIVAARVVDVKTDGRREGRIVRVVESKTQFILGVFREALSGAGVVEPLERGLGFEITVPRDQTAGARGGEIVRVHLTRPPTESGGEGKVAERLGLPDDPGVDVEVLIRKYGFAIEFPADVLSAAEQLPGHPENWPLEQREDFTGDVVVTIDGETAKDFDDAICVSRLAGGGFRLTVHIADVAWFVGEGTLLDTEAVRRGTSVYFPGRCIPMLPERLSNDLCSLRPHEIRLTQGVTIDYAADGTAGKQRFHDGFIRSAARLTYNQVAAAVEERDPAVRRELAPVVDMLDTAAELARLLADRRSQRGAIDFDLPEPEVLLDITGATTEIVARRRNLAHRMLEEFMLAANEAVAEFLVPTSEPALYRAHERPDRGRVGRGAELLAGLGYDVPEPYEKLRPRHFAALVREAQGRPEEPFVTRTVLRMMALARYDAECLGHFGLALTHYLHFTSPIRRYPDLVCHRALRRLTGRQREAPVDREERALRLPDLARECSRLEREAEAAERESLGWRQASHMAQHIGDDFEGTIVDVAKHGITVALTEPYIEGLVPIARLGTEFMRYDPKKHLIAGTETGRVFRLGQRLRVLVDKVDRVRGFIDFALAEEVLPRPRHGRGAAGQKAAGPSKRGGRQAGGGRGVSRKGGGGGKRGARPRGRAARNAVP